MRQRISCRSSTQTETIEPRKVKVGLNNNVTAEVVAGLEEGDQRGERHGERRRRGRQRLDAAARRRGRWPREPG